MFGYEIAGQDMFGACRGRWPQMRYSAGPSTNQHQNKLLQTQNKEPVKKMLVRLE